MKHFQYKRPRVKRKVFSLLRNFIDLLHQWFASKPPSSLSISLSSPSHGTFQIEKLENPPIHVSNPSSPPQSFPLSLHFGKTRRVWSQLRPITNEMMHPGRLHQHNDRSEAPPPANKMRIWEHEKEGGGTERGFREGRDENWASTTGRYEAALRS